MLSLDRKELILMHPVRADLQGKKFRKMNEDSKSGYLNENFIGFNTADSQNLSHVWDGVKFEVSRIHKNPLVRTLVKIYIQTRMKLSSIVGNTMGEEEFFEMVKGSFKELETASPMSEEEFKASVENLFKTGQKFLVRSLQSEFGIVKAEQKLKENGITKYQEESDLVDFVLKSKKGLALIEMSYFRFSIPDSVVNSIVKADELEVFDNFYILYTDPDQKLAEVEVVKEKKDPVVFGVISGSTKLYYIDDWVTDYCSVTYEEIVKTNGQDKKL